MLGIAEPVGAVGDEGEGPDLRDAGRQRVDVALGPVEMVELGREPGVGDAAGPHHEAEQGQHQLGVGRGRHLAVVGHLAHFPQPGDVGPRLGLPAHVGVARRDVEHHHVLGHGRPGEARLRRRAVERGLQGLDAGKIQRAVAPLQDTHGREDVVLQRLDLLFVEGRASARGPERAVLQMPPGAARDLAKLGRVEPAVLPAVELAVAREGHVVDVEVEPHADRVGGHQVVDLAVLVHGDLGVAGARAERPQHHRGSAPLAPDQLGDGVDLLGREGHDGGTVRQARQLLLARVGEFRQARARHHGDTRQQLLDDLAHGGGADHQRLVAAAPVQQPVGEHVAAVEVGGDLDLVHGQERHVQVARHGFHGRDPVTGVAGLDLLLAGDQRDAVDPGLLDDPAVDFAGQQPERQPDDARRVAQHALDRVMGLAGVGGAQYGGHASAARARRPGLQAGAAESRQGGPEIALHGGHPRPGGPWGAVARTSWDAGRDGEPKRPRAILREGAGLAIAALVLPTI